MACQEEEKELNRGESPSMVYINKVATFGLSPASYWWTRIAACGIRLARHIMGKGYPLELLLCADDLEVLGLDAKEGGHPYVLPLACNDGFSLQVG